MTAVENVIEVEDAYTVYDRGSVTLAGTTYAVSEQVYHDRDVHGDSMVWLKGPRGATYFLRRFIERKGDTGLRQVISWKSGAPLRKYGNEIRVVHLGDVIEQVTR